jgi:hypothetical protein
MFLSLIDDKWFKIHIPVKVTCTSYSDISYFILSLSCAVYEQLKFIPRICVFYPKSIEWFIEGQAFSRSYESAPRPSPSPFLGL